MSKITNSETEASVSCGFYNSDNHDRKYDAIQMSSLFDGLLEDGVFESIGDRLMVKASSGNIVTVGTGKCWFNHTWTENDALLSIDCGLSDLTLNRYDAIVVEVNSDPSVRDNFIKVIHGERASNPVYPDLVDDDFVHQHALCYIYREANSYSIRSADIINVVGTSETPYVTGVLKPGDLATILDHWQDELDRFVDIEESDFNEWFSQMRTLMDDAMAETDIWIANQENTIIYWFNNIKDQLSSDAAVNLQLQIDENEVKQLLMNGFPDGTKTFSDDGTTITSIDSTGRKLVKTFTNSFLTCTTILYSSVGGELGRLVKNFSSDGKTISSEMTII